MPRLKQDLSAFTLACFLPALRAAEERAEAASMRLNRGSEEYARAGKAWHAACDRTEAFERMVLAAEPMSLADVAAQILLAANEVGVAIDVEDGEEGLRRAVRALHRCLPVIAEAAGINLADIAVNIYAPDAERPAGDVA